MAYAGIDRKRFAQLLEWGTDDDELRRFFTDTRVQLIQKGAKVQNLPHGKPARVRMLTHGLPLGTDRLLQTWCAENLTMLPNGLSLRSTKYMTCTQGSTSRSKYTFSSQLL